MADDCRSVVREVISEHGRLDILVNNAGIAIDRTAAKMTDDDWHKVIDVNLSGAFFMAQAALEHMIERGTGRVVNVSSVIGETGNIGQANYAASKSGLFGLTKSLAREAIFQLGKAGQPPGDGLGVTVNVVTPGFVATEMWPGCRTRRWTGSAARSRWDAWAGRTRSPGWSASSPPTTPPTSLGRCGRSTVAWTCREVTDDRTAIVLAGRRAGGRCARPRGGPGGARRPGRFRRFGGLRAVPGRGRPGAVAAATFRFGAGLARIGPAALSRWAGRDGEPPLPADPGDRRFADPAWEANPAFFALRQWYLAARRYGEDLLAAGG